ncbi:phage-shock protein, partial [Prochlorothrix hollandica PCC 9006 = CALU 1027]
MLDETLRSVRMTFNRWLNQADDPEKILEQVIQEMQDQMIQMRQAVAQAIATHRRTERQCQ